MLAKEPYMLAKEPCSVSKEAYNGIKKPLNVSKEPHMLVKEPSSVSKEPYNDFQKKPQSPNRALQAHGKGTEEGCIGLKNNACAL